MRIKQIIVVLLSVISVQVYAQWTEEMYSRYTYANYTDYYAFNQSITQTGYDVHLLEAAIFYETNYQRAKYGLPQLQYDYNLRVCAHNHSVDMVQRNFFSHTSVVYGKEDMSDRLAQVGYTNCACAENIIYRTIQTTYAETARYLLQGWMNSQGHRANILNAAYTHLGCGAAFYQDGGFIYVKSTQNFIKKSAW